MSRCDQCGGVLARSAEWCGLCGQRVLTADEKDALVTEAVADVRATVLPRHRVGRAPGVEKTYSRWWGGPTSLPPAGKVTVTAAVLFIAAWFFVHSPGSGLILFGAALYVIRETWRKRRIR